MLFKNNAILRGRFCMLLCVMVWSAAVIWCKRFISTIHPFHFACAEALGLAAVGGLFCWFSPRYTLRIQRRNIRPLFFIALWGSVLGTFLWFFSLRFTQAVNATCLAHTQVFFIAYLSHFQLKESWRMRELLGSVLFFLSAVFVGAGSWSHLRQLNWGNSGDLLAIGAAVFWAMSAVQSKALITHLSGPAVSAWRGAMAFLIISIGGYLFWGMPFFWDWTLVIYGALVGLGLLFYYLALQYLKAIEVGLLELSTPFFLMIMAQFFLNEIPTFFQWLGAAFLLPGFILIFYPFRKAKLLT